MERAHGSWSRPAGPARSPPPAGPRRLGSPHQDFCNKRKPHTGAEGAQSQGLCPAVPAPAPLGADHPIIAPSKLLRGPGPPREHSEPAWASSQTWEHQPRRRGFSLLSGSSLSQRPVMWARGSVGELPAGERGWERGERPGVARWGADSGGGRIDASEGPFWGSPRPTGTPASRTDFWGSGDRAGGFSLRPSRPPSPLSV